VVRNLGLGFGVWGSEFWLSGAEFGVWSFGYSGLRKVWGSQVWGLEFWGLEFWVSGVLGVGSFGCRELLESGLGVTRQGTLSSVYMFSVSCLLFIA